MKKICCSAQKPIDTVQHNEYTMNINEQGALALPLPADNPMSQPKSPSQAPKKQPAAKKAHAKITTVPQVDPMAAEAAPSPTANTQNFSNSFLNQTTMNTNFAQIAETSFNEIADATRTQVKTASDTVTTAIDKNVELNAALMQSTTDFAAVVSKNLEAAGRDSVALSQELFEEQGKTVKQLSATSEAHTAFGVWSAFVQQGFDKVMSHNLAVSTAFAEDVKATFAPLQEKLAKASK